MAICDNSNIKEEMGFFFIERDLINGERPCVSNFSRQQSILAQKSIESDDSRKFIIGEIEKLLGELVSGFCS